MYLVTEYVGTGSSTGVGRDDEKGRRNTQDRFVLADIDTSWGLS